MQKYIIPILLTVALLLVVVYLYLNNKSLKQGFTSSLMDTVGTYPVSVNKGILNDYPSIGKNQVSNDSAADIWWHYPIFTLPSFKQQTNNLRYYKNPDEGTCTRPEFCGAFYKDKHVLSNEIYPLPPAEEGEGARVGYFRTEPNKLYYSIPTNENILY